MVGGWRLAVGGEATDDALRGRFRALAADDEGLTPTFRLPEPPARGRWPITRLAYAAAAVVVLASGAGYAWRALRSEPPYPIDLGAVTWTGPTDFLLETPGASLLRDMPAIGGGAPLAPGLTDDTSRRNRS
jgi:hypothetical protein